MREARIAMRTIDAAWTGKEVADEDLKRMAEAAERIKSRDNKREEVAQFILARLIKAKREDIGIAALAKILDVDATNLARVVEGKRKLPKALILEWALLLDS